MKLLLASDDLDLGRTLGLALTSQGITVDHCIDPMDVQGRSWRALPDLIMVDLDLPLAAGISLLRRLQDDPRCRNIPVVMTSAVHDHVTEEVEFCWRELQAVAFLPRPFSMLELPELIYQIATSGWTAEDDNSYDTIDETGVFKARRARAAQVETDSLSLHELRLRRLETKQERRQQSLPESVPAPNRSIDPSWLSAGDLNRELEAMRDASPSQVLGLASQTQRVEIEQAARRKRKRLEALRDDFRLVPQVRMTALELLEVVTNAEHSLLNRFD